MGVFIHVWYIHTCMCLVVGSYLGSYVTRVNSGPQSPDFTYVPSDYTVHEQTASPGSLRSASFKYLSVSRSLLSRVFWATALHTPGPHRNFLSCPDQTLVCSGLALASVSCHHKSWRTGVGPDSPCGAHVAFCSGVKSPGKGLQPSSR